ncbi:MAG: guanylate kinase [Deltaproteobacteria bacterium]|nr:guanylate kinase [Deltaproteobacteria bacterium]
MSGIPFIVSAPSGAGKTTLCKKAVAFFSDLRQSISYTTRKPREGEINGVDYWFIDNAAFDSMVKKGEFLEHADIYGKRYGTSRKDLKKILEEGLSVILEIDVQGAESVRGKLKGAVYVFILPPSLEASEERLKERGKDSAEEIRKRLKTAAEEIKLAPKYDYIIINEDLDEAFEKLKSVIIAEKSKSKRMMGRVKEGFGEYL